MNWLIDWQALSARIKGVIDAGTFFYTALHSSSTDSRSVKKKVLLENAERIVGNLKDFSEKYNSVIPNAALDCLSHFLEKPEIKKSILFKPDEAYEDGNVQFALTSLSAFQSEFNYLIADTQFIARRITERAFIHLQRSIVADEEVRNKWNKAFNKDEEECEKLGALHLLSHGVWAFKADANTGKTDLILNEPLPPSSVIVGATDALVLTEWKKVNSQDELDKNIQTALKQAVRYSSVELGGVELTNYRYLVMVSKEKMDLPEDITKGLIHYRLINIAVNRGKPSVEAKRRK